MLKHRISSRANLTVVSPNKPHEVALYALYERLDSIAEKHKNARPGASTEVIIKYAGDQEEVSAGQPYSKILARFLLDQSKQIETKPGQGKIYGYRYEVRRSAGEDAGERYDVWEFTQRLKRLTGTGASGKGRMSHLNASAGKIILSSQTPDQVVRFYKDKINEHLMQRGPVISALRYLWDEGADKMRRLLRLKPVFLAAAIGVHEAIPVAAYHADTPQQGMEYRVD